MRKKMAILFLLIITGSALVFAADENLISKLNLSRAQVTVKR